VSWSVALCSCIEWKVINAWMVGVEVVGGIYSRQPPKQLWGWLLSMGAPDSPMRHPRHPTVRVRVRTTVGALSSCGTGQTLFTVRCASGVCSDFYAHCSIRRCLLQSTVALVAVAPLGAPDSPVNYSGARP
jgi:hypothetical protein